ncbi:peptidyl-prolyl cis-trans isomerase B (cyclophilin B) [Malonomonas rubra DSM 5091]|uniref:Peptidyl-prolyl cis-trans isomerase n=1 Tax=Malonomonas rubra DSM 5091 TaxID=1122189 RepID=A0A1M6DX36_MALRU|nr:peptidylprolyl isomerase [Malonomonas rubra]SHI77690.1 peptidyl-prolyl cis-trans isomerase B (cyclophilin B) [Malonomonas rubra DSM 5091]
MSATTTVRMQTSMGQITIELDNENAPISSENFLAYVRDGFYEQTIFHRVIPNFMVQGGGFTSAMKQKKTKAEIKNEADNGLKNERGTLAMARTQIVDSATCQFFINLVDNDFLNHKSPTPSGYGYAVFGKVTEGMDVVDEIAKVATGNYGPHQDVPKDPVLIESVSIDE